MIRPDRYIAENDWADNYLEDWNQLDCLQQGILVVAR